MLLYFNIFHILSFLYQSAYTTNVYIVGIILAWNWISKYYIQIFSWYLFDNTEPYADSFTECSSHNSPFSISNIEKHRYLQGTIIHFFYFVRFLWFLIIQFKVSFYVSKLWKRYNCISFLFYIVYVLKIQFYDKDFFWLQALYFLLYFLQFLFEENIKFLSPRFFLLFSLEPWTRINVCLWLAFLTSQQGQQQRSCTEKKLWLQFVVLFI